MKNIDIDDAFDLLHEIVNMNIEHVDNYFNPSNVVVLKILWDDLFDHPSMIVDTVEDFHKMLKILDEGEANLSKELGSVLLISSKYKNSQNLDQAKEILNTFINNCCSKAYKDIANIELDNL